MKKTWEIGEYCKGGIISVSIDKDSVTLYLKEWDFSKGSNARSDQSNAKVLDEVKFTLNMDWPKVNVYDRMKIVLNDWTTSYYADIISKWITEQLIKGV